jgi:hypothetical protein
MRPDLDRWLSTAAVRTAHRRQCDADVDTLWRAAQTVRLRDCRLLGRLVAVRMPGSSLEMTFDSLFRSPPFHVLEQDAHSVLSGLCGRIWTPRGEFATLADSRAFIDWGQPGTARVLFAHWAQPAGDGAELHSEVRIAPVDRRGAFYLRAFEPFISAFQGLVGLESLALAARRAEAA